MKPRWRAEPRPEPDSGNPTVRDRRGASGNVASWSTDLHAARAPDFYLDNRMHGSMWRREETRPVGPTRAVRPREPPADPTICFMTKVLQNGQLLSFERCQPTADRMAKTRRITAITGSSREASRLAAEAVAAISPSRQTPGFAADLPLHGCREPTWDTLGQRAALPPDGAERRRCWGRLDQVAEGTDRREMRSGRQGLRLRPLLLRATFADALQHHLRQRP
jgi:hypothetical protein